nr:uncharacterized protein LOC108173534 [Malus domestica]
MNALPTKVNLKNRRVLTEDICGLCDKEPKPVKHTLLQCPRLAAIWFGSPLGICMFPRIEEDFGGWLINMAKTVTKDSFELLLVLVWSIWKVSNEFIWKGVDASPLDVQLKSQTWPTEFKKWNEVQPHSEMDCVQKWTHPEFSWITCNFDAAWDENGGFMAAMVLWETGVSSAMHAEAIVARAAAILLGIGVRNKFS